MKELLHKMVWRINLEDASIFIFGASFIFGVWYALPMVNNITDVWAFGGGVLRAMEAHTLFPGYGVAYGTLSFYQNLIAMTVILAASLPFFNFDVAALKTALILNPSYTLLVPRIVSALTAIVFLGIVYRFLKHEIESALWRFALIVLVFGNVLTAILVRSGKMWILSTALGIISFIFMYRAVTEEVPKGKPGTFSTVSIFSAFLSAANFAFDGIFLINVPILVFLFPKTYKNLMRLATIVVIGLIVFIAIFALNADNVFGQVSVFVTQFSGTIEDIAHGINRLSFFEALAVNLRQTVEVFPILLVALIILAFNGIHKKTLAILGLIYATVYLLALSFVFRADDGISLNIRHVFPIGFFLLFVLSAIKPPVRLVSHFLISISLIFYIYITTLLSLPTTYNLASDYIVKHYGDKNIRIDESIFELTLPMNKKSYMLHSTSTCGSACTHSLALPNEISFRPIIVTHDADPKKVAELPPPSLFISSSRIEGCLPIARFGNDISDHAIFDIDINLGRMLMPEFYKLRMLGKNLYLYNAQECVPPPFSVRQ